MFFTFNDFKFPVYGICILLSLVVATIFIYINLRKNKIPKNIIMLSLFMTLYFVIVGAKLFTMLTSDNESLTFWNAGLSSYGGAIGLIFSVIAFNIMYNKNKDVILTTYLLALPLLYSISKLGCFFVGCCKGIPYDGIFHVNYNNSHTVATVFPVQLLETILFACIFIACLKINKCNSRKYINEIILILCAIGKFLLDFLRESHIGIILSPNQIVSIIFLIVVMISIYKKRKIVST